MPKSSGGATRSLKEYQAKRNFSSTPEPSGRDAAARKQEREKPGRIYCVQKHLASHLHYDLRLEHGGVLLSWAVPKGPSLDPKVKRLAMRVEDHPLDYHSFEGVIPSGYGAGIVMLWDEGSWEPEPGSEDVGAALERGELKFRLKGKKLGGGFVLVRTKGWGDAGREGRSWLLIKHRDEFAQEGDVLEEQPRSVRTKLDFAGILADEGRSVWESHRPAEGGAAGKLLQKVIADAAAMAGKRAKPRAAKRATGSRSPAMRAAARRGGAGARSGKARGSRGGKAATKRR